MKYTRLLLVAATLAMLASCNDRPVGILSIPIYESDLKEIQKDNK